MLFIHIYFLNLDYMYNNNIINNNINKYKNYKYFLKILFSKCIKCIIHLIIYNYFFFFEMLFLVKHLYYYCLYFKYY